MVYRSQTEIKERVRKTLSFTAKKLPHEHGFFYHFIDMNTGERIGKCELSSIDSSLFYCGILTARQYFSDPEIQDLATKIYERVDWPWMLDGGPSFSMGWHPETGFIDGRWSHYCELMMIYLFAIGLPTHPVGPGDLDAWTHRPFTIRESSTSQGTTHYSHTSIRRHGTTSDKRDKYADYFENSVKTHVPHNSSAPPLRDKFPDYNESFWGISASDLLADTRRGVARLLRGLSMERSCRARPAGRRLYFQTVLLC